MWISRSARGAQGMMLFLSVIWALVGCGSDVTASGGHGTPTPSGPSCGHVQILQARGSGAQPGATAVENCFWSAYQHCQAATLTLSSMGVDVSETHTFSLRRQANTCALSDSHDRNMAPRGTTHVGTYACHALIRQPDGGLIAQGCGQDGDVAIPAPAAAPAA